MRGNQMIPNLQDVFSGYKSSFTWNGTRLNHVQFTYAAFAFPNP